MFLKDYHDLGDITKCVSPSENPLPFFPTPSDAMPSVSPSKVWM